MTSDWLLDSTRHDWVAATVSTPESGLPVGVAILSRLASDLGPALLLPISTDMDGSGLFTYLASVVLTSFCVG